jgi:hypothetical protein
VKLRWTEKQGDTILPAAPHQPAQGDASREKLEDALSPPRDEIVRMELRVIMEGKK